MKITDDAFHGARKDKTLTALIVASRNDEDGQHMTLCLDLPVPYSRDTHRAFVMVPTEIRVENYKKDSKGDEKICFHCHTWNNGASRNDHVRTFLKMITKSSDVKFHVIAYNCNDAMRKVGFVGHTLYGIIDDKTFLLNDYVGPDNLASPIQ